MRKFIRNKIASVFPIAYFIIVLGFASFLYLLMSSFLEFFLNFMGESYTRSFFVTWWAHGGILIWVLIVSIFSLLLHMHMSKYESELFKGGGPQ